MLHNLNLKQIIVSITASVAVSGLIIGLRNQGNFEQIELLAYDFLVRLNAESGSDPRITIVEISHSDLQQLNRDRISDATLKQTLETIAQYKPRVIGVDLIRNIPIGEGTEELITYVNNRYQPLETAIKPIIFPCALPSENKPQGIAPPTVIDPYSAIGYIDLETDPQDIFGRDIIRRASISSIPVDNGLETVLENRFDAKSDDYLCTVPFSFSFLTALSYIQAENIATMSPHSVPDIREVLDLSKITQGQIKLKSVTFRPLKSQAGSYRNLDPSLYQYLIDYRYTQPGTRISLTQVLENKVTPEQIKDQVVLIGYTTRASIQQTPVGSHSGVLVQGWMISQLLSNVLDGRKLIWTWSEPVEWLWIISWGIVGSIVGWLRNSVAIFTGGMVIALAIIGGSCWLLFTQQGWIPLIPSAVNLVISSVVVKVLASSGLLSRTKNLAREETIIAPVSKGYNPQEDSFIGKTIGKGDRYILKQLLGQGGMSQVYLAFDKNLNNKKVAIKIMMNYFCGNDQDYIKRFIGEIEKLCLLNHPNIIQIKEQGVTPDIPPFYGYPFYVMEYFTGKTLRQILSESERITYDLALKIILKVSSGLKEAHKKGIIHRDIKPSNIFLSTGDSLAEVVKIIDFGIAKQINQTRNKTSQVTIGFIGTYNYASPEQIRGAKIDSRTDIYSLGIVLYEILSGTHPFKSQNNSYNLTENLQPLTEQPGCENIPLELADIVTKCLEKSPQNRFQTMEELEQALRNFVSKSHTEEFD